MGTGVGVSVGIGVSVMVGVKVGVGGKGVEVAFFLDKLPGKEHAVHRNPKAIIVMKSQRRIRFFMPGTITEEDEGVK